ncbi:MAG: 30S ribosomal protein S11 [Patescibacteria group bacterium]|nr:30S ribosomal protein S11 [Patescibacteria group bacterium]
MGKKKVAKKFNEETINDSKSVSTAINEKTSRVIKHKIENGCIYIQASFNNTIMTVTDDKGNVITWLSAGSIGFSGPKKATPFAASRVAEAIAEKIKRSGPFNIRIFVRGIGKGRDSAVRSLAAQGFNILSIKDITPVPHNGPKPPKVRRV